eukprot:Pgem_evm1s18223
MVFWSTFFKVYALENCSAGEPTVYLAAKEGEKRAIGFYADAHTKAKEYGKTYSNIKNHQQNFIF